MGVKQVAILLLCLVGIVPSIANRDCVCFDQDYDVKGDNASFTVPKGQCAKVFDEITGLHSHTWHHINYTSQTGWIQFTKQNMTLVICSRKELATHICLDVILNCHQYNLSTPNMCHDYPDWSKTHCRKTCDLCELPCLDLIDNCAAFGPNICKSYFHWSGRHCKNYCKFCDPPAMTTSVIATTSGFSCQDKPGYDCKFFKSYGLCDDPDSARPVCPKYCDLPECRSIKMDIVG